MKNFWTYPVVLLLSVLLGGCAERPSYLTIDGFAQGSTYHFVLDVADTTGLQHEIDSLFAAVDHSMSVYEEGSLINRLNANETDSVDRYIAYCIAVSDSVSRLSDGMYDITIKPVTEAWGFAGKEKTLEPNIDSLLQYVGYEKIKVENGRLVKQHPNVRLDLNSVAQGYTADLLGELMEKRGIENYMVEIGGEIFCRGVNVKGREWVVGIDKPVEGNYVPGADLQVMLSISGKGLATSGNYRKFYVDDQGRKITHIVDARTGRSEATNVLSATVIARDAVTADVYGTLMILLGLDRTKELLERRSDLMAYIVYADDEGRFCTYVSENMKSHIVENPAQ